MDNRRIVTPAMIDSRSRTFSTEFDSHRSLGIPHRKLRERRSINHRLSFSEQIYGGKTSNSHCFTIDCTSKYVCVYVCEIYEEGESDERRM